MTLASFLLALLGVAALMSVAMAGAFLVEQKTRNSGWIDVVWTFGLGATGFAGALLPFGGGPWPRRIFVAVLVASWALRLGLHIAGRTRNIKDDPRYAQLRRDWGKDARRRMFIMLQMQALASIPLGLGIVLAAHNPALALGWQDAAGMALFALALVGGAVADRQLRDFTRDPAHRGRVCDVGLWRWSRHPNYFFECLVWATWPLIAISLVGYPYGFVALLAPICITLLLTRISGIPPLEEHMLRKHGEAYAGYQERTSALIPWPPRSLGA